MLQRTQGTRRIDGLDSREDALKRGELPGADWGREPRSATLQLGDAEGTRAETLARGRGDWSVLYVGVRDAILGRAPNPVPPDEALTVQRLLELGRRSAVERRELRIAF